MSSAKIWFYDLRTNKYYTLEQNRLSRKDLDEFVELYQADSRHERKPRFRLDRHVATGRCRREKSGYGSPQMTLGLLRIGGFALMLSARPAAANEGDEPTMAHLDVGLRAMVTYESGGPNEGAVAVNVVPLVLDWRVSEILGVRSYAIVNYQFGGEETGLSNLGGGISLPFYLGHQSPFWVGPYLGASWNRIIEGVELTPAVEAGVTWTLGESWLFSLAVQVGATYFSNGPGGSGWVFHPGLFPTLSYRLME